jgi:hypothetical protein
VSLETIGPREILFGNLGINDSPRGSTVSTEATGHIVFGARVSGLGKNRIGATHLHQLPLMEKGRLIGQSRGLLHVMGDHQNGVIFPQLSDEILDPTD